MTVRLYLVFNFGTWQISNVLKPCQNKKGQKVFQVHHFLSQLPAVEKDNKNGAPRKYFDPSYFVTALRLDWTGHVSFLIGQDRPESKLIFSNILSTNYILLR